MKPRWTLPSKLRQACKLKLVKYLLFEQQPDQKMITVSERLKHLIQAVLNLTQLRLKASQALTVIAPWHINTFCALRAAYS